jgi:hypothetical protein
MFGSTQLLIYLLGAFAFVACLIVLVSVVADLARKKDVGAMVERPLP